jgi:hypothetical protein
MRLPSASELVTVWESGLGLTPIERGLRLLAALFPEASDEELAHYTIGERDAWLLTLREQLFGAEVASVATCPHCGEPLELNFSVSTVRTSAGSSSGQHREVTVHAEGYAIRSRLPTSADLLAVAGMAGADNAQRALLARCILAIEPDATAEAPPGPEQLPAGVAAAIVEQMAQADPQADVRLALVCPACSHQWLAQFDILSFLWAELSDWVQRTLREVHQLAMTYGWREADILAMSAWRRQWYLQLIGE